MIVSCVPGMNKNELENEKEKQENTNMTTERQDQKP